MDGHFSVPDSNLALNKPHTAVIFDRYPLSGSKMTPLTSVEDKVRWFFRAKFESVEKMAHLFPPLN